MWKYIEPTRPDGTPITKEEARLALGVTDPACPCLVLENGWIACWAAAPFDAQSKYPALSSKPADPSHNGYPSV